MSTINFEANLIRIGSWNILRLPKNESVKLQSRGMVMVEGTINGIVFKRPLEPDGNGSHWLKVDDAILKKAKANKEVKLKITLNVVKDWPEPNLPADFKKALDTNTLAQKTWSSITPMARWDWVRWISSTKNSETRKIRIEKTFSKLKSGIRRPCCFNRTECTVPEVSNKGKLITA